ncbi:hypothetical protein MKZ38_010546 [Zalerion maritima]|uniref:Uncharacterized protein n=1 Tax=Zalerion maritima TaxID=339359 RepID=A0AAD5WSF7_9PEZI|nr:hypothetical protein MKZ38_010546 [Zalerion maritima]
MPGSNNHGDADSNSKNDSDNETAAVAELTAGTAYTRNSGDEDDGEDDFARYTMAYFCLDGGTAESEPRRIISYKKWGKNRKAGLPPPSNNRASGDDGNRDGAGGSSGGGSSSSGLRSKDDFRDTGRDHDKAMYDGDKYWRGADHGVPGDPYLVFVGWFFSGTLRCNILVFVFFFAF